MKFNQFVICLLALAMTISSCGGNDQNTENRDNANNVSKEEKVKKRDKKKRVATIQNRKEAKRKARFNLYRIQGEKYSGEKKFTVTTNDGKVRFLGWAFDDVQNEPGQKVFVEVNGKLFRMNYGEDSKHLGTRLKNAKLNNVGFRGSVKTNDVKSNKWKTRVIVFGAKGKKYYASDYIEIMVS